MLRGIWSQINYSCKKGTRSILSYCQQILKSVFLEWKSGLKRPFFPAYKRFTDGPTCCHITPYLDFELNETGNEPERLTHFSGRKLNEAQVPLGACTGMKVRFETVHFFTSNNIATFLHYSLFAIRYFLERF